MPMTKEQVAKAAGCTREDLRSLLEQWQDGLISFMEFLSAVVRAQNIIEAAGFEETLRAERPELPPMPLEISAGIAVREFLPAPPAEVDIDLSGWTNITA